jgi:hypothetical protein
MEQNNKKKIRDKISYLYLTYGKMSIQPFFSDNIQNKYIYGILSELRLYDIDDTKKNNNTGKNFSYSAKSYNEIWTFEKFNAFVSVDYSYHEKANKEINYSFKNNQLFIKVTSGSRVFSVPLKDLAVEFLEREIKNEKQRIFKGNDYIVLISEVRGYYYETTDSISVDYFKGYLFYNK